MSATITVDGDLALVREFEGKSVAAGAAAFGVTRRFGLLLQSRIVARAQGRPGPRRRTGDYIRSWNTVTSMSFGGPRAEVGTSAPQARRLEFGFTGEDALGRHYNQPPYPHVRPALDSVEAEYEAALAEAIGF